MGLETYRDKRDFRRTPEPRGKGRRRRAGTPGFVVQKHAARSLHYDFRLEVGGVLASWAVPKGPPLAPGGRALAVRTEDHPLAYAEFEGVIPKGAYGGGTVLVWDRGTWTTEDDAARALERGKLSFTLAGERLRGRFTLVRTGGDDRSWLLLRRKDDTGEGVRELGGEDVTSVLSGRTLAEVAAGAPARGDAPRDGAHARQRAELRASTRSVPSDDDARVEGSEPVRASELPGARRGAQPRTLAPQLATLVDAAPTGDDWLHELKHDGYRLLAFRTPGAVHLLTRGGEDWTARFPGVAAAVRELPVERCVLDGEVVVLARDGRSDFQALQNALRRGAGGPRPAYVVFDLPHCDGYDLTRAPLVERKRLLAWLTAARGPDADDDALRYGDHVVGDGPAFAAHACELALEGAVSKRADAPYVGRRARTWRKTKCLGRQEFVVGGWTEPGGGRSHLGALLLGVYADGVLRYAGKVGTGFDAAALADLYARLAPLEVERTPFEAGDPPRGADLHWTEPEEVVEVSFTEWTQDGRLRHPVFQGRRADKPARDVRRERPRAARSGARSAPAGGGAQRAATTVAGVRLSHPDRVLYPDMGLTKADLAAYYEAVAAHLLPHVAQRALSLVRCPRGRAAQCFYQKHPGEGVPDEVRVHRLAEADGEEADYVGVDDLAGLVALVQLGVLELHPWGSRVDRPDRPDRLVLDLDPGPDVEWARVVDAAHGLRALLAELELESFVRTTGGKGLHVVLPITRRSSWDEAKAFARGVAATYARRAGTDGFVLTASKARRNRRIFLDVLRNARGATAVASYSTRARPGATVACPLRWDELTASLDPRDYDVRSVPRRLAALAADPWEGFEAVRQSLTAAAREAVGAG